MTLIEVTVAMGLASILILALTEMTFFSARAGKSEDSVSELNRTVSLLVTAINSQHPYNGNYNDPAYSQSGGCNQIFYQMPFPPTSPTALYTNYANVLAGKPTQTLIQITPGVQGPQQDANAINHLKIQNVTLNMVEGPINSRPDGSLAYLYYLEITAQKTNIAGSVQVGGNSQYVKDIYVELWTYDGKFVGCS